MLPPIAEEKSHHAGKGFRSMLAGTHCPPHYYDFLHFASLTKSYGKRESKCFSPGLRPV